MEKLKIVQVGCGKMSAYTMRYAIEKGYEIVGAVDANPNVVGKDISEIIGSERKNVIIKNSTELDSLLKEVRPDICIVTTTSLIKELDEILSRDNLDYIYRGIDVSHLALVMGGRLGIKNAKTKSYPQDCGKSFSKKANN